MYADNHGSLGMELLRTWAERDDMITELDSSELIEHYQKEKTRTALYNTWLDGKTKQDKATQLLRKLPQHIAQDRYVWQQVGRACYAVSRGLLSEFTDWACYHTIDGNRRPFGPHTESECQHLWNAYRPRTSADSKEVLEARDFLQRTQRKLNAMDCPMDQKEQLPKPTKR